MKIILKTLSVWLLAILCTGLSQAQNPPKREFRGVWIATVANIDWPSQSNLSPEAQRDEFRKILNEHEKNGINAVIVQVRPSADALFTGALVRMAYRDTREETRTGVRPAHIHDRRGTRARHGVPCVAQSL